MPRQRLITHNGETKSLSEWAAYAGISMKVLHGRLKLGWNMNKALSTTVGRSGVNPTEPIDRLLARVTYEPNSGCWLWTGNTNHKGYGQIGLGANKMLATHRVAYEALVGPIASGLHVMHSCDVRCCCNPAHLSLGTNADNARDRWLKGRYPTPKKQTAASGLWAR